MRDNPELEKRLVRLGVAGGLAASIMYPVRSFLPLSDLLQTWFFVLFGPLLVVAFVGIYPFMSRPRVTVAAILGSVFGIIGATANMMFSVVQLNNLHFIGKYMRAAESAEARQAWLDILNGVFTVQNGLNYIADFFFDWTIFLWAMLMWTHPKFGKFFTFTGIVAGGFHFVMKMITFPEPPAEAGLFDAGPLIGLWFAMVTLQVLRHLKWMDA